MSSPQPQASYPYPPITIVIALVLLLFFFVGFFSIYFFRCFLENLFSILNIQTGTSINLRGRTSSRNSRNCLDPRLLNSFPTFPYSSIKGLRKRKSGLECAICLAEFEDESVLRLLTVCYHVFHQECIDLWLEGHKTCPVCRDNLDLPLEKLLEKSPVVAHDSNIHRLFESNSSSEDDAIGIEINESRDEEVTQRANQIRPDDAIQVLTSHEMGEKLSRSHSTGHSVELNREGGDDRYRLRLRDHIKVKITKGRGHSDSSITFEETYSHQRTDAKEEASGCSKGDSNNV